MEKEKKIRMIEEFKSLAQWQFGLLPDWSPSPLCLSLWTCFVVAYLCWALSLATLNSSWVDRIWSIIPAVYIWQTALYSDESGPSARLLLMSLLATVWSVRLTYNFARKGGYWPTDEDYRWPVLRTRMNWALYQLFNLMFISAYQNVLLWWIASPALVAKEHADVPLNAIDAAACVLFLLLLAGESVADQQQWTFQNDKYRRINANLERRGDARRGFLTAGLFRFSRHPNFFCEISMWCVFYLFAVAASGQLLHWSALGALQLVALFQGSTTFTEALTAAKYPQYRLYQQTTSRLVPMWPSEPLPELKND
jgi:steroid 5-alpha reductase family enzyme